MAGTDRHRTDLVFFCSIAGGSGTRVRVSGSDGNASAENCMSSTGSCAASPTPPSWRSAAGHRSCRRAFVTSSPWTPTHGFPLAVSYTHLRAHETRHDLVCRLLLEK